MPKITKKFIDKKDAVTFKVVHRSQQDPLVVDETAPQRVLIPVDQKIKKNQNDKASKSNLEELKKRKEEQHKFGIYFDDDYNYLQHLRSVDKSAAIWERVDNVIDKKEKNNSNMINLPSSVFESNVEEEVGLLNKAAPIGLSLDIDPDVMEIYSVMDDNFDQDDSDNFLPDDFVALANASNSNNEDNTYDEDYEEDDEVCSLQDSKSYFNKANTKSYCGSSYSMSSSVIRRNENLKFFDDKHEVVMSEFDDTEIGSLDFHEIEGQVELDSNVLLQYAKEFEEQRKQNNVSLSEMMKERLKISELHYNSEEENANDLIDTVVDACEKDRWDCQSILSTNSTTRNHPRLISEKKNKIDKIIINPRTGIPMNVLGNSATKLTAKNLEKLNLENFNEIDEDFALSVAESRRSQLTMLSYRPQNETLEEKRERKKNLKEYRRERRIEKKANTLAFKQEQKRQEKIAINNRANVQGNKIF